MSRLGSVSPSRRARGTPLPNIQNPTRGLVAGIDNLRNAMLGNEDALNAVREAEAGRQLKIDRAKALSDWSETKGRIQLRQAELAQEYDPSGKDYFHAAQRIADEETEQFYTRINPNLHTEFEPDVATFKTNRKLDTYGTQVTMESAYYKHGLGKLQKQATDEIFSGTATIEDWVPRIQEYVDNSPLSQLETEVLAEQLNHDLQAVDYAVSAKDELENWQLYNDTDAATGFPAGMPGPAVGLLTIIGQTESGMRWNVLNGGEAFSDMKQHPGRTGEGGTSTAAGAFQFVKGTWEEAQKALGLEDFSPASQVKAAWWLAERDYRRRTGRNILADLSSGDPVRIEEVRKTLAGKGEEGVTWQALQNVSPEAFFAAVTGGKMTMPGSFSDPTYDALTRQEKLNALEIAQKAAGEALAKQLEAQDAQRNLLIEEVKQQISGQLVTREQITQFADQEYLSQSQRDELIALYEEKNADAANIGKFSTAMQTPGSAFGPEEEKGFDALYRRDGRERLAANDQAYMNTTLLPATLRSGHIPADLSADLQNKAQSSNTEDAQFAYNNLAMLQQQDPMLFASAFGERWVGDVQRYRMLGQYQDPGQTIQTIRDSHDPTKKRAQELVTRQRDAYVQSNARYFTAPEILNQLDFDVDLSATKQGFSAGVMQAEFLELFTAELALNPDEDEAYETALERLKTRWGQVDYGAGENYLLKNPPSRSPLVRPIDGSYSWVSEYTREDFGLPADARFRLMSDHITAAEISRGQPPSYMAEVYQNGVWLPHFEDGQPVRSRLDQQTPEMRQAQVDNASWTRQLLHLEKLSGDALMDGPEASTLLSTIHMYLQEQKPKFAEPPKPQGFFKTIEPSAQAEALRAYGFNSVEEAAAFAAGASLQELLARKK